MSIIKSFDVGDGDMFYIYHNTDNFTIIDCCYTDDKNRDSNFDTLKKLSKQKEITRFISTHPDEDHIKGLKELDDIIGIVNFYVVKNEATKNDESDSFKHYCEMRDDTEHAFYVYKGCSRKWMNLSDEERGSSGINYLWPDRSNQDFKDALEKVKDGAGFNNISPIFTCKTSGAKFMWMGDMEKDFVEKIKDEVDWPEVDILFAPHHGRKSGKAFKEVLDKINPQIIVIGEADSEYLDYYEGYNTITQNSAKDITFKCEDGCIRIYSSNENYKSTIPDIVDDGSEDMDGDHYIGTITARS